MTVIREILNEMATRGGVMTNHDIRSFLAAKDNKTKQPSVMIASAIKDGRVDATTKIGKTTHYRLTESGLLWLGINPMQYTFGVNRTPIQWREEPVTPHKPEVAPTPEPTSIEGAISSLVTTIVQCVREEVSRMFAELSKQQLELRVPDELQLHFLSPERHQPEQQSQAAPKKPTVLVGGLLPSQIHFVESAYSDRLDLRFATTDDNGKSWQIKAKAADHIVLMSGFIGHWVQDSIRKATQIRPINVRGGVSSVTAALQEYCTTVGV